MTVKTRNLLLAFAVLGLGASVWSSYVHYALLTQPGYLSVCDVNATVSCTQAYLSQYGSLWGIPVALGGVLFFTVVSLIVALGGRQNAQARENIPGYVFALSTIGLAFVLYLAWASFFELNAVCLLCVTTYVAVIGLFIVSGRAMSTPMSALPGRASRDVGAMLKSPVALALAIAISVGFVSLANVFPQEAHASSADAGPAPIEYAPLTDQQKFELIRWYEVQPKVIVPVAADGARVVIVKFHDFQCPACRSAYFESRQVLQKYASTGQVKYVVKHYPLEPECNPYVPGGTHRASCESAAATIMASSPAAADKVEEWLFTNQATLTPESVRAGAAQVGGITDFDARYAEALKQVSADAALGDQLKVRSTPTFFINGRLIAGGLPPAALEAVIEHELKRTQ
jgi:uncharacterized membrane protein/protein-disulfide isomerase